MKIECLKDKILRAVNKASRLVTNKNAGLPILSYLLMESKNNRLTIQATNLDLGVSIEIPVRTEKEGRFVVPGELLNNLISNLPSDNLLTFEVKDDYLNVATSKSSTRIKISDSTDFPSIPTTQSKPFSIPTEDFVNGLKSVWYSCSHSSIKPELASLYVHTDDKNLVFAATDSFRLAEKRVKTGSNKEDLEVLIPLKNAIEITRIIEGEGAELLIYPEKNQISLSCGDIYITSRVIDGNFPDYKQIIPKEFKTNAKVLKQDLVNALKVASVLSDQFNQVNVKVLSAEKNLEIKTKNSDVGENICKIDAVVSGQDININFNLKYISDCLSSIEPDSLILSFDDLSRPMVIKGSGDESFLYLAMLMNK